MILYSMKSTEIISQEYIIIINIVYMPALITSASLKEAHLQQAPQAKSGLGSCRHVIYFTLMQSLASTSSRHPEHSRSTLLFANRSSPILSHINNLQAFFSTISTPNLWRVVQSVVQEQTNSKCLSLEPC
jgi:hypothetical protein